MPGNGRKNNVVYYIYHENTLTLLYDSILHTWRCGGTLMGLRHCIFAESRRMFLYFDSLDLWRDKIVDTQTIHLDNKRDKKNKTRANRHCTFPAQY